MERKNKNESEKRWSIKASTPERDLVDQHLEDLTKECVEISNQEALSLHALRTVRKAQSLDHGDGAEARETTRKKYYGRGGTGNKRQRIIGRRDLKDTMTQNRPN